MAYESRAYDNEHGDPVVVLVVDGTHDVSRLVNLLAAGTCEQVGVSAKVLRQVRRHNGGREALRLLAAHGGPDFSGSDELKAYRTALVGLHQFVENQLDPDPTPWASYHVDPDAAALVARLEAQSRPVPS
jgi:hypothetical protein